MINDEWLAGKKWPIEFFETLMEVKHIVTPANKYGGRQPYDIDGHISFLIVNDERESYYGEVTMVSAISAKEVGSFARNDVIEYLCKKCFTQEENVFQLWKIVTCIVFGIPWILVEWYFNKDFNDEHRSAFAYDIVRTLNLGNEFYNNDIFHLDAVTALKFQNSVTS